MTRMQCVGKELGCVRTFEDRLIALNFVFTQKRFQSQGFHAHAFLTILTSDSVSFSKSLLQPQAVRTSPFLVTCITTKGKPIQ